MFKDFILMVVFRAIANFFREADIFLLVLCIASTIFGIVLISSITAGLSGIHVSVQIGAMIIGIILFVLFSYVDIDIIADKSVFLFIFSVLFIASLLVWGVGEDVQRVAWLRFGQIGIQPAEITKVTFIIVLAKMVATFKERRTLNSPLSLLQIGMVFLIMFASVIYISDDLGTAIVYLAILLAMLFAGGLKLRWFLLAAVVVAAVFPFLWNNFFQPHQQARILAPFAPDWGDPYWIERVLWQPQLSVRAISGGGFFGQGLGNGFLTQGQGGIRIPAQHTDFIFSGAGEELGFLGCIFIVILLVAIIIRCFYVGAKSNNSLGFLVSIGITAMFMAQTLQNIGMTLGVMPVIGLPLPFFSYGGSSIVTYFAAAGIISGIKMRPKPARFRSL